jgi:hypothetical protein
VPMLRTLFGAKKRPGLGGTPDLSPRLAVVIETPRWDLTLFKVHFGLLTLKGYTKGEHVLRFEAVTHNTKQLGCGRAIEKFPQIVTRLKGMAERFSHHPGLHRHRLPCRRHARRAAAALPHRPDPGRRHRPEQATDAGRAGGGPGPGRRTRRLHRRRPCRQGPGDGRPDRLHPPPGRLRPAQAARQGPARQTRPVTALPDPPPAARTIAALLASATRSSAPSSRVSATHGWAANPPTGPASTATTRRSASACRPSSPTSASQPAAPQHRQPFVDPDSSSG